MILKINFDLLLNIKILLILTSLIKKSYTHGRMNEPAARNAAWRYGYNIPANYNDNELNCGGAGQQYSVNGGKCGICGDSYNAVVKQHQVGGKYATGTIVRTYSTGQIIDVNIFLSANHKGFMQFRLCPVNNPNIEATQECLNQNLLRIEGHGTSYDVRMDEREISLKVKLPEGLVCSQCVIQWKYRAGNNWGTENGVSGPGIGPQEEFYNCADIAITNGGVPPPTNKPLITTTPIPTTTSKNIYSTSLTNTIASSISISTVSVPATSFNTQPFKSPISESTTSSVTNSNAYKGQIVCAIRGIEKNQAILYAKVKNCLENCSTPDKLCPNECLCIWLV